MLKHQILRRVAQCTLAVAFTTLVVGCSAPDLEPISGDFAFVGVNVVDIEAGKIEPDQTVVIAGDRIVAVRPSADVELSPDTAAIEASGKYLAPGLMDMHTHLENPDDLAVTLAHGVTTARVLWGKPSTLELRAEVEAGEIPGPRIITAGYLMDGDPPIWAEMGMEADAYTEPEAMDAIVAEQKAAGYDFIKTYSRLTPEVFSAILEAGKKHDIDICGHIPQDVPLRDAIEGGMKTSEHFIGVMAAVWRDESLPNPDVAVFDPRGLGLVKSVGRGEIDAETLIDPEKVAAVAEFAAQHDHWFVPTHDIMRNFTNNVQLPSPEAVRYLTPQMQAMFKTVEDGTAFGLTQEQKDGESILYVLRTDLVKAFHDAGAKILVGTDHTRMSGPATVAEINALHDAGFSRRSALDAATLEPARYLGLPGEVGVVAGGAIADLILLNGDPLEDLDALKTVQGVMYRGTWLNRAELDDLLDGVAARAAAAGQ